VTHQTPDSDPSCASGVAAVVGARGFIGSALLAHLRAAGLSVSSFTRDVPFVYPSEWTNLDATSHRTVFWLAGSTNPAVAEQRPDLVAADDAALTSLLEATHGAERMPRVVVVSSGGTVYDPTHIPPYAEDSPLGPVTAYGRAKLRLEHTLERSGLPDDCRVIVRVSNAYGPGQRVGAGQGVIAHWLDAAVHGRPLVLFGDPATARDYVYVGDVVDALVRIHRSAAPPAVVNVGSGEPTSLATLHDVISQVVGRRADHFVTESARAFDLSRTWLDIRRAEQTLGWRPATSLRAGITSTWRALTGSADVPADAVHPA
jgi:UDP-glucose 4-epimerase